MSLIGTPEREGLNGPGSNLLWVNQTIRSASGQPGIQKANHFGNDDTNQQTHPGKFLAFLLWISGDLRLK
jgi:hypothetical protein